MLGRVLLALAACVGVASAMRATGEIETKSGVNWALVSSFCFDTDGLGKLWWQITPITPGSMTPINGVPTGMQLAVYDDEKSSFPSVWPKRNDPKTTCPDMVAARKNKIELKVPAPFNGLEPVALEEFKDTNSGHQWFIAVAGCGKDSLNFKYNLSFEQGPGSPYPDQSAELQDLPAPTVFYAIFMVLALVAFVLVTLRSSRAGTGVGLTAPAVHKLVGLAVIFMILANFCAWAWSAPYDHPVSSLRALLFFQGLCQTFIMLACGFLAVANKRLEFIGKILGLVFCGLAALYWLPFFIQGLVVSDFPGVGGAETFANGWSIIATLLRFFAAIAWGGLTFLSFQASKIGGGSGEDQMGVFQWFIFSFAVFLWLFVFPIAVWANFGNIYSCNPSSLVAGYAIGAIFDGLLIILIIVCVDPAISRGIFGDVLGAGAAIPAFIMFHTWAEADWTSGGATAGSFQSSGYSTLAEGGISSDDFADGSGTAAAGAAGSASGGADDGTHQSYQTL